MGVNATVISWLHAVTEVISVKQYGWIGFVTYSLPIVHRYFTDDCFVNRENQYQIDIELFARN